MRPPSHKNCSNHRRPRFTISQKQTSGTIRNFCLEFSQANDVIAKTPGISNGGEAIFSGDRREEASLKLLHSGDGLVLEKTHDYTTIPRLSFRRIGVADLFALSHFARRKHSGEWGLTLLKQDICHILSPVLAEFLVQRSITGGGGVALYFNHVAFDCLGFIHERHQLSSIFWIDVDLAVVKVHRYFIQDVVIVQLAEACDGGIDSRLIFCDLCRLLLQGLSLRVQLSLLFFQIRLVLLS